MPLKSAPISDSPHLRGDELRLAPGDPVYRAPVMSGARPDIGYCPLPAAERGELRQGELEAGRNFF